MNRPPLGVMPRYIHDEQRCKEVADAIIRYVAIGKPVPSEWVEEYNELINRSIQRTGG